MKIFLSNTREIILGALSLALELPQDIKPRDLGLDISEKVFRAKINDMKKDKLLSMRKDTDVIRLKHPAGRNELLKISQELSKRYENITNGHDMRKGKDGNERLRVYRSAVLYMLRHEATIDNIDLTYKANAFGRNKYNNRIAESLFSGFGTTTSGENALHDREGNILPIRILCRSLAREKTYFYSSRFLKESIGAEVGDKRTTRLVTSIFSGVLLSQENAMTVYYIRNPEVTHSKENEKTAKSTTAEIYKTAYGMETMQKNIIDIDGGQALLIFENEEDVVRMARSKVSKRFKPEAIYKNIYVLPAKEECDGLFWLIRQKDFRQRTLDALYYYEEQTPGMKCDAVLDGNIPSWEFLTSDFGKLKQIKTGKERRINIICYDWQEKILKELLVGYSIEFDVIDEERFDEFRKIIEG